MNALPLCRSLRLLVLTGVCIVPVLTGCKTAANDDSSLGTAVAAKLQADSALQNEPVQATVRSGVATLEGAVSSPAARALAANDVAQVPGIRTVINNLSVAPSTAAATPPPAPAETVSTPPPPPVPVARNKPSATVSRRPVPAPAAIVRQPPPAVSHPAPPSPATAPSSPSRAPATSRLRRHPHRIYRLP